MSGVNILPKARTGQLPLALAERPFGQEWETSRASGPPLRVRREATTVRHDVQGLVGLTARGWGQALVRLDRTLLSANHEQSRPLPTCLRASLEGHRKVMTTKSTGP